MAPPSPLARALLVATLAAGCGENPGSGAQALMLVEGAELRTEALVATAEGPPVVALTLTSSSARPGEQGKPFSGALGPGSTAVAVGLTGDLGYWLLPAAAPDVQSPDYPTFDVRLSFSADLLPAQRSLFACAGDDQGRFGIPATASLDVVAPPPPAGALVVSLFWDTDADLDLHVVMPGGVEIWKRDINSYEPPAPGEPVDPNAWKSGAVLDFDSNAECVIDGRRRENVIWKEAPPPGKYVVRVDTFSLCSEAAARWSVETYVAGERTASAQGMSTDADTRAAHDRGAGVLALTFEVP